MRCFSDHAVSVTLWNLGEMCGGWADVEPRGAYLRCVEEGLCFQAKVHVLGGEMCWELRPPIERVRAALFLVGDCSRGVRLTSRAEAKMKNARSVILRAFFESGSCRIRTCDQWIKSPLLYQLS